MKRSQTVIVTAVMVSVSLSIAACDNIDDRTVSRSNYGETATYQPFNFEEEKKLRISCDKPEDFSLPECHDKRNQQAVTSTTPRPQTHSSFIFMPMFWGNSYAGGGYSSSRNYGPASSSARTYSTARSAVAGQGLASTYRASTVPASSLSRLGSIGSSISARSTMAGISRGGFGGTGRAIAAATSAHAGAISGS